MISVKNLKYAYGKIQALNGISFDVNDGEVFAIIGANGAGKSTLMKCISGLLKYQEGDISCNGVSLPKFPYLVVKKGIVLVPEGRWIFPNLTVEENLIIGGYTSNKKKITIEKVYALFPRLKERRIQRAGTLSGGEQQMLAIGRGLMSDPKVLLLDEPSLGLAPLIVSGIFKIIKEINREGVTVIVVEQNAKKALSIADHACVLEVGKIGKTGSGKDLLSDPHVIDAYLGGKKVSAIN